MSETANETLPIMHGNHKFHLAIHIVCPSRILHWQLGYIHADLPESPSCPSGGPSPNASFKLVFAVPRLSGCITLFVVSTCHAQSDKVIKSGTFGCDAAGFHPIYQRKRD